MYCIYLTFLILIYIPTTNILTRMTRYIVYKMVFQIICNIYMYLPQNVCGAYGHWVIFMQTFFCKYIYCMYSPKPLYMYIHVHVLHMYYWWLLYTVIYHIGVIHVHVFHGYKFHDFIQNWHLRKIIYAVWFAEVTL